MSCRFSFKNEYFGDEEWTECPYDRCFDAEQCAEKIAENYWDNDPVGNVEDCDFELKIKDNKDIIKTFIVSGSYSINFYAKEINNEE